MRLSITILLGIWVCCSSVMASVSEEMERELEGETHQRTYGGEFDEISDVEFEEIEDLSREKFTAELVEGPSHELDYETILSYIKTTYKKIKAEDADQIASSLVDHGKTQQIDPKLTAALIARESAFNRHAVSVTGAKGLGQIKDFNFESLKIKNPYNIQQNINGTTTFIKQLLGQWKKEYQTNADIDAKTDIDANTKQEDYNEQVRLALASYYKGFTAVKNQKESLDKKTISYVDDIFDYYQDILKHQSQVLNQE